MCGLLDEDLFMYSEEIDTAIRARKNGFKIAVDTIGITPSNLSQLDFDNAAGSDNFYGNTKQIQYFDSALTDTDLEELTSWDSFRDMAEGQLYTIE